ncbi:hypothetical protein GQ473_01000 [archaeon]|nr:hypothetical protein [archaeon]
MSSETYDFLSQKPGFPKDQQGLEKLKEISWFEKYCIVNGINADRFINYAIKQLDRNQNTEQIGQQATPHDDNIPPETTETSQTYFPQVHSQSNDEKRYDQKRATPVYGGNRLSDEDEAIVIKYLFSKDFNDNSIESLREKIINHNGVILDTPYIFELALLDILNTNQYDGLTTIDSRYIITIPKNKEFLSKLDKLYKFITKERIEKEGLDSEDIYIPAVNTIISNNFNKQYTLDEIFNELKSRDTINETINEFIIKKGKSKIEYLEFHPAIVIFKLIYGKSFEKDFTKNALEWYEQVSGTKFSECFSESTIPSKKIESLVNDALRDTYKLCISHSGIRETIEYIEYINTIKLANDFLLNAGFKEESEIITGGRVDPKIALKIIKQQKMNIKDGSREKFLAVMEFMNSGGYDFSKRDSIKILKEWHLEETNSKNRSKRRHKHHKKSFKPKVESIDSRIFRLYQEFGGTKEDLIVKTPAQIFEERRAAAKIQKEEAELERQRNMDQKSEQRANELSGTEYKRFKDEPRDHIEFTPYNVNIKKGKVVLIGISDNGSRSKIVAHVDKSIFDKEPTREELLKMSFSGIVTGSNGYHLNVGSVTIC